jgi:hypothetical protein
VWMRNDSERKAPAAAGSGHDGTTGTSKPT